MSSYKFLINNVAWLTASRLITKVIALFSLPIITFYLSPKDFGIIAMFAVVQALLSGLFTMGLPSFAARMIFKYERTDKAKCREYLGRTLVYQVLFSTVGAVMSALFAKQIFHLLLGDMLLPNDMFFYIPMLAAFLIGINGFISNNLISLQLNKRVFCLEMTEFVIFIPGQIIGLMFLGFTVWDVIILQLVAHIFVLFVGFILMKDWLTFNLKRLDIFNDAMRYSLPMVPLNFASWIQDRIDKVFLNRMVSLNAVGLYSAGVSIATQYSFISRPITNTLTPEISKRLDANDPNIQNDIKDLFMFFFQVSIFFYFAISLLSKEVVKLLLNVRFYECYHIIPIFLLSIVFAELTGIFNLKFIYRNKTIWFPVILSLSTVLNIFLNLLLIPNYDIYGAALAKTMTAFCGLCLAYYISQKLHRSNYNLYQNFIPLIAAISVIYILNLCEIEFWLFLTLKLFILLAYVVALDYFLKKYNARYAGLRIFLLEKAKMAMNRTFNCGV